MTSRRLPTFTNPPWLIASTFQIIKESNFAAIRSGSHGLNKLMSYGNQVNWPASAKVWFFAVWCNLGRVRPWKTWRFVTSFHILKAECTEERLVTSSQVQRRKQWLTRWNVSFHFPMSSTRQKENRSCWDVCPLHRTRTKPEGVQCFTFCILTNAPIKFWPIEQ